MMMLSILGMACGALDYLLTLPSPPTVILKSLPDSEFDINATDDEVDALQTHFFNRPRNCKQL